MVMKKENNKKIGILTLNGYSNYGNVLQNVAVQTFFKNLEYEPETIWYSKFPENMNIINKFSSHLKKRDLFHTVASKIQRKFSTSSKLLVKAEQNRQNNFKLFCKNNIKYSDICITEKSFKDNDIVKKINDEYISFFSGSDQVWGLDGKDYPEVFFLPFTEKGKRNSFAASFGFSSIPNRSLVKDYKNGLNGMNAISVREYEGQSIINDISNAHSTVLLDPVFLLNSDDWEKRMTPINLNKKNGFLLTYFLGERTEEYNRIIKFISEKKGIEIINLNDIDSTDMFSISPDKYLYLFKSASYVVTDSFHGLAFSIIFRKNFLAVDRTDNMVNMSSRIRTLLSRTDLTERFFDGNTNLDEILDYPNFDIASSVIDKNVEDSKKFVKNALNKRIE